MVESKASRVVPAPWVSKVRGDWPKAVEFECEFRKGTRGAWRPVPGKGARLSKTEVTNENGETELGVEQARDYAQELFDACHSHNEDEVDGRCDYRLQSWGPTKDGTGREPIGDPEGRGGRLPTSEDVPEDDDDDDANDGQVGMVKTILKEMRIERSAFVTLILKLSEGQVSLAETMRGVVEDGIASIKSSASEARQREVDLREIELKAYRTQEGGRLLDNIVEKAAPGFTTWAQARYQESTRDRKRKPTGSDVKDKFLLLVDGLDLLTWNQIKEKVPASVLERFEALVFVAEMATDDELVKMWSELREPLTPHWQDMMGVLPEPLRRALSEFAYAVESHEKKGKRED